MNIFVDLDGTLKTESFDQLHQTGRDGEVDRVDSLVVHGKNYRYIERPHVKEFFEGLTKLGKVFICTAASQGYARAFVAKFGVDHYINAIYSRENMHTVKSTDLNQFIIIDNDPTIADQKVFRMERGGISFAKKIFVEIKTYDGREDDDELLKILERCQMIVDGINKKSGRK